MFNVRCILHSVASLLLLPAMACAPGEERNEETSQAKPASTVSSDNAPAEPKTPALSAKEDAHGDGHELFQHCAACHLPTGDGVPGVFPPLGEQIVEMAATEAGREYLYMVIETGLLGEIHIGEETYRGVMPSQHAALGDDGAALVLNYIVSELNADSETGHIAPFSDAEAAAIKTKYRNYTNSDVLSLRARAQETLKE